ncbi:hypothetical protein E2542_SST28273 [Spatholobus suberectus]|nr:hypothetical protein E2542_SST28273 [Spatholobus suberectus]
MGERVLSPSIGNKFESDFFIISSYLFYNPSSNTFTTITEIQFFTPLYVTNKPSYNLFFPHSNLLELKHVNPRALLGFAFAYDFSYLCNRTKDILSITLALLFGIDYGYYTAIDYDEFFDDDEFFDNDESESPKKLGYVKISAIESTIIALALAKGSVWKF